jgi:class 3 adenylate cyclase
MHCWARLLRADDYPWGVPQSVADRFVAAVTDPERDGGGVDDVALMAPSLADDAEFRSWWRRAGQRNASPAVARAVDVMTAQADLRSLLPTITVPTLVLHRVDNAFLRLGHSRFLADRIPNATLVELPGRDHLCFVGETVDVVGEIEEFLTGARSSPDTDRVLATVLFTDIVDSTRRAAEIGDRQWRGLLDDHDRMVVRQIRRFGGHRVKTTGDGVLAFFDGPARAIRCALAIRDGAHQIGLEVRGGLHTGEVERRDNDIAGIAVHIAARVQARAAPNEVWVSRTVSDLIAGSELVLADRGEHDLKGLTGAWQLFAVGEPLPAQGPRSRR